MLASCSNSSNNNIEQVDTNDSNQSIHAISLEWNGYFNPDDKTITKPISVPLLDEE